MPQWSSSPLWKSGPGFLVMMCILLVEVSGTVDQSNMDMVAKMAIITLPTTNQSINQHKWLLSSASKEQANVPCTRRVNNLGQLSAHIFLSQTKWQQNKSFCS